MTLGQQGDRQGDLVITWREMPRSLGYVFYNRLQRVLIEADFEGIDSERGIEWGCADSRSLPEFLRLQMTVSV